MESIWGKLEVPTPIQLSRTEKVTKSRIRQQVWDFLEEHDLVNFPRPVHKRIPNFKGAATTGLLLASLPEFKEANVVKVNPDKPQEEVRYEVLDHNKTLLVPARRLKNGLFNLIENPGGDSQKENLKMLASIQGIDNHSKPLPLSYKTNIDVVVIGSVAVDKLGHHVGKGEGFADLEYAMAVSTGAITTNTIVIATVHDCQLFDALPEEIFGEHDITVDIVVTPTIIHRVETRLPKPTGVMWEMISADKFKRHPVLRLMKENGDGIPDVEKSREKSKVGSSRRESKSEEQSTSKNAENSNVNSKQKETIGEHKEASREKMDRGNLNNMKSKQKENVRKNIKDDGEKLGSNMESNSHHMKSKQKENVRKNIKDDDGEKLGSNMESNSHHMNSKQKEKVERNMNGYEEMFDERPLLYVGQIPRNARVRDLKVAIMEREVKLKQLVWKGYKGFAFLYFDLDEDIENIFEALKDLKIGECALDIQREKYKD